MLQELLRKVLINYCHPHPHHYHHHYYPVLTENMWKLQIAFHESDSDEGLHLTLSD